MKYSDEQVHLFLQPGDFHFGSENARISTLLGSCVAITLWHPEKKIGGMCHYMLPSNPIKPPESRLLDGKYAEDVMEMFMQEVNAAFTTPKEYQVKVFGGGQMFPDTIRNASCVCDEDKYHELQPCQNVACKNVYVAHHLLKEYGFKILSHDLGGTDHRKVIFEMASGDVWLKKGN